MNKSSFPSYGTITIDSQSTSADGCHEDSCSSSSPLIDTTKPTDELHGQNNKGNFSVWSIIGVGFSLTNSWFGVSVALVTGLDSGGPVLLVYGIILIFLVSICVGISLSELSSAIPSAGGQYYWASELAPRKYANFASYLTGWLSWIGSIFTSASVALSMGSAIVGCYQLSHPEFEIQSWHIFITYQLTNLTIFSFNCNGKLLPKLATATLYISLASFTTILITVPASAPTHRPASFVFATFINHTGWPQNPIAFIVGLINANWAFACLDCATHLAEEVPRPEKSIPIAIMATIAIGFLTSWLYVVAIFFSISGSFDCIRNTATGVPILQIFYGALESRTGAILLEVLIIMTGLGCLNASHTWQSRCCWSFARDGGLPFSAWLGVFDEGLGVPLHAHMFSCTIVAGVGCLYLASGTAFNSMVSACVVLLYVSYSIPVVCLLIRGRDDIKHGPFWMGGLGLFANCVLLVWTCFTLVMYSFPVVLPVRADNMNYVSVVYGVVMVIVCMDWYARGRKHYRDHGSRHGQFARVEY